MLTVEVTGPPEVSTGRRVATPMRSAMATTSEAAGEARAAMPLSADSTGPRSRSGTMTRNSSPPWRATRSSLRISRFTRAAVACRTSSPTRWPSVSLVLFKLSRST